MQITETLNDKQRLMSLGHKEALEKTFSIFNEMVSAGYNVEFYYVSGFGGLTIVPRLKRIRVKANQELLSDVDYCSKLALKIREVFESRFGNKKYLAGIKLSLDFQNKGNKVHNLNWEQAIKAMEKGKRVRNQHFTSEEWFEMRDGRIYAEDGCPMTGWYRGDDWQKEGWSILND